MGARFGIAILAKYVPKNILRIMGYIALVPAISFMFLYLNDLRKIGAEAGGKIWWNKMRPVHACMYLLFATYAIKQEKFAWLILLTDAFIGLIAWYLHRYQSISF
jgi:hypothetical protein